MIDLSVSEGVYTVENYILSKVKFEVPIDAIVPILFDRNIDKDTPISECDTNTLRLIYADLLKWMVLGPSKYNNTSDTDNGWTHSSGGYQLTKDDIAELKKEANSIYKDLEPTSVFGKKSSFKINSFGIKRADINDDGSLTPHIIK